MSSKIEMYDQKRKKYRGHFILSYGVAFIAFIVRSILKIVGTQAETLQTSGYISMGLAFLCICFGIRLALTERTIRKDPLLKEAIYNELDRLNELKAWKIAFYSLILFNLAAVYLFHIMALPLKEPVMLMVASLLIGFGSFGLARYLLDR